MDSPPSSKRPLDNDDNDDGDPVTKIKRGVKTTRPIPIIQSPVDAKQKTDQNEDALEYCTKQKQHFHHLFEEIISELSTSNFSALPIYFISGGEHSTENGICNIKTVDILNEFKRRLLGNLTERLDIVWQTQDIDQNLSMLQDLIKLYCRYKAAKWRPSGKTGREQTRAFRIELLKSKIQFLQNKIEPQTEKMSNMVIQLEKYRKIIEDVEKRRLELLNHMKFRVQNLPNISRDIANLAIDDAKLTNEWR